MHQNFLHDEPSCSHKNLRYDPIGKQQFDDEVFSHFYGQESPISPVGDGSAVYHRLALLYMVLAAGALMDPQRTPYNIEAEKYHQLARAALFKSSIFDEPTLHAVQALVSQLL